MFVRDVLVNGVSRFDELLDGVTSGRLTANSVKNIFDLPFSEGLDPLPAPDPMLLPALLL